MKVYVKGAFGKIYEDRGFIKKVISSIPERLQKYVNPEDKQLKHLKKGQALFIRTLFNYFPCIK